VATIWCHLNRPALLQPKRVVTRSNNTFGPMSLSQDARSISVRAPLDPSSVWITCRWSRNLQIEQGNAAAQVIINREGTIVIGQVYEVQPAL